MNNLGYAFATEEEFVLEMLATESLKLHLVEKASSVSTQPLTHRVEAALERDLANGSMPA